MATRQKDFCPHNACVSTAVAGKASSRASCFLSQDEAVPDSSPVRMCADCTSWLHITAQTTAWFWGKAERWAQNCEIHSHVSHKQSKGDNIKICKKVTGIVQDTARCSEKYSLKNSSRNRQVGHLPLGDKSVTETCRAQGLKGLCYSARALIPQ